MRLTILLIFIASVTYAQNVYDGFSPYILGHSPDTTNAILVSNDSMSFVGYYLVQQTDTTRFHYLPNGLVILNGLDSLFMRDVIWFRDTGLIRTPNMGGNPNSNIYIHGGGGDPNSAVMLNLDKLNTPVGYVYMGLVDVNNITDSVLVMGKNNLIGWTSKATFGGGDSCLWYYVADDTIKTWHNVWVDSSFNTFYSSSQQDYYIGMGDNIFNQGYPLLGMALGYPFDTDSTALILLGHNGTYSVDLLAKGLAYGAGLTLNSQTTSLRWGSQSIYLNPTGISLSSDTIITFAADSFFIPSLPIADGDYFMAWNSITGQFTAMDTTGWKVGGMGDFTYYTIGVHPNDTLCIVHNTDTMRLMPPR